MFLVWILDGALQMLEWFLSLFGALPTFTLPAGFTLIVPVPLLSAAAIGALDEWFAVSVSVLLALQVGRVLQWLYSKIPFVG